MLVSAPRGMIFGCDAMKACGKELLRGVLCVCDTNVCNSRFDDELLLKKQEFRGLWGSKRVNNQKE